MIIRFHRDNAESWKYFPALLDRLHRFVLAFDVESEPAEVVDLVRIWFASGNVNLGLWGIVSGDQLVAHLFATPEPLGSKVLRYVLVRQAEVDRKIDCRVESRQVFENVKQWTTELGLTRVMSLSHRNFLPFVRKGWKPYKMLYTMQLDKKEY